MVCSIKKKNVLFFLCFSLLKFIYIIPFLLFTDLRQTSNVSSNTLRERQGAVEERILTIERNTSAITFIEKDIIRLREKTSNGSQSYNILALRLSHANDELSILHERIALQQISLEKGEKALAHIKEEIHVGELALTDSQRTLTLANNQIPITNQLKEQLQNLNQELEEAKKKATELEAECIEPIHANYIECQVSYTKDETLDVSNLLEHAKKLEKIREEAQQSATENELYLEELNTEIKRLNEELDSLVDNEKYEKMNNTTNINNNDKNDIKLALRLMSRRLRAALSELSMYEAQIVETESTCETLVESIEKGKLLLKSGLAPSERAERRWLTAKRNVQSSN